MVIARGWREGETSCSMVIKLSYARRVSSRDLLYNTVPRVDAMLYTHKFGKRLHIMLNGLTTIF